MEKETLTQDMFVGLGGSGNVLDPRPIHLYSYYRDAELRGAELLLKLIMRIDDPEAQIKLSRHLADETRHAWLWTKRIADLGGTPFPIDDGYQTRIGKEVGIPRTLIDLFALTVVVEERAQQRYLEHASRPDVDPATRELLYEVTKDEKWHLGWIKNKLKELATSHGGEEKMRAALERYREIDRKVTADMMVKERAVYTPFRQVFISHSSKDKVFARRLAHRLTASGLKVWIPEDEIFPGDNWAKKVGAALEESDIMVVLITPHAFESEWLKEEIQYALTSEHYQGRLIPVFLGHETAMPADAPWILRKLSPVRIEGREEDWQPVVDKISTFAN